MLGGLLVAVVWLYLLNLSVLVGGELNATLHRKASEAGDRERDPRADQGAGKADKPSLT